MVQVDCDDSIWYLLISKEQQGDKNTKMHLTSYMTIK